MKITFDEKNLNIGRADINMSPFQDIGTVEYVLFDFVKPGWLEVKCDEDYKDILIRPKSKNIKYEYENKVIRIYIEKSMNFSIEPEGKKENAILIFAGSCDKSKSQDFENVIYFPPGEHDIDCFEIDKDNTLLYIEEGAVLNGKICAVNKNNVSIDGMGILTMRKYSYFGVSVYAEGCKNFCVKNILILDSCNFHCMVVNCDDIHINNLRFISYRGNSDGIDICGSRNAVVENVFSRVWDDALVVKGLDTGNIENVVFKNCILWNDFARPMEMGVSLRADEVKNVVYRDIDVIHSLTGYPIMGIHHGDRAEIHDVHYENIRIEDNPGAQLFDVRIHTGSAYNKDNRKGKIHHIYFKDIEVLDEGDNNRIPMKSRVEGYSDEHNVKDIFFENVSIYGKQIGSAEELGLEIKNYTSDIHFKSVANKKSLVETNIICNDDFVMGDDGYYEGSLSIEFKNVGNTDFSDSFEIEVYPAVRAVQNYTENIEIKPGETKNLYIKVKVAPGKTLFYLQSKNIDLSSSYGYINLPLNLQNGRQYTYPIMDCVGNGLGEFKIAYRGGEFLQLEGKIFKDNAVTIYYAKPVEEEDREVIFSVEETNLGLAPALTKSSENYALAPQIGCVEEITYVYKNQPKTEINKYYVIKNSTGIINIPVKNIGMKDSRTILLEIEKEGKIRGKKFTMTFFGSQIPDESAHMYVTANLID